MAKRVSISDIAESLGVSKALVSLVINDKADAHGISAETQKRVRDKIRELNYQPDLFARSFRVGKTNTIGLIVSDISNRFYARIARDIEDHAWNNGYTVIICSTDENVEKEMKQIKLLRDRKIDGLIISSSQDNSDYFNKLSEAGFPHVLIDRRFDDMQSANVSVDNYGGARLAAEHLLKQGFSSFAVVALSPDHISTIRERIKGFTDTLGKANVQIPPCWLISLPFDRIDKELDNRLQSLHRQGQLPEAIFTLNNNLTSSCLKHLTKLSVNIPEDVAVIGFDDIMYFEHTHPSVSAIGQPTDRISEEAFKLLLQQINNGKADGRQRSVVLPVDIIIRESSIKH
ncbi:MAG: LacI family transcriptional regulator [Bacteroidia bacterium]|nr:MAG: LacI family transcriptional regulator [Bacteroidia bacterium]